MFASKGSSQPFQTLADVIQMSLAVQGDSGIELLHLCKKVNGVQQSATCLTTMGTHIPVVQSI